MPQLPQNETQLLPCEVCPPKTSNVENTELYAVHPYRLITVGKPQVELALRTMALRRFHDDGWRQLVMDAALLGATAQARDWLVARAVLPPAAGYRFPAFSPHLQDYPPSADHLAVHNAALTYMLLQLQDDEADSVLLLPAWDCSWDVEFRLHAPRHTVITGAVRAGKVTYSATSDLGDPVPITAVNCVDA